MSSTLAGKIADIEKELESVKKKLTHNRERFESSAGSWSDIDEEEFKERVREERENSVGEQVEL